MVVLKRTVFVIRQLVESVFSKQKLSVVSEGERIGGYYCMFFHFSRKCLREVKKRHFCRSARWVSLYRETCSHCLRIAVDCLTVEGQTRYDRFEDVDFEEERNTIIQLYRGTPILQRRGLLEERVLLSLGLLED